MEAFGEKKLSILIYGAGSIGVFLGAVLYSKGHDVVLFGGRKLKRLHDSILINGELYKTPPRIYSLGSDTKYDMVFVTTKLYHSKSALEEIRNKHISSEILVLIQNGLVDEDLFKDFHSHPGFVTVSVFEGYHLLENQLLATKSGMGWQTEKTSAGKKLYEVLESAGIKCVVATNLDSIRAEKMILVNAVGALSAIEKKTLGELITEKETRKTIEALIEESYAVLKDEHNMPGLWRIKRRFYKTISQIKTHYSSMYQDILSGRETEIEYLNGYIVKLGVQKGIPTPVNLEIYNKLKAL
jgi:2-dehydropantoate 2-reductase